MPTLDTTAAVKYISWDGNQWVSYDDSETFSIKIECANSGCLGGVIAWVLDLDTLGVDTEIDSLTPSMLSSNSTSITSKGHGVVQRLHGRPILDDIPAKRYHECVSDGLQDTRPRPWQSF